MNIVERAVDATDPVLSARMRLLKMTLRHDVIARFIRRNVASGSTVVDVGANRGVYSWALSSKVGPSGRVHAVEPFFRNIERLRALARHRRNITVHAVALSDHSASAELHVPLHHGREIDALASIAVRSSAGRALQVPVRRLDDLLPDDIDRVALIKCDVEGYEDAVLTGGWGLIEASRPTIVIEIEQRHRTDPIQATFDRLLEVGYRGHFIQAHHLRPLAEFDVRRHQLALIPEGFTPFGLPRSYVCDFVFVPTGRATSLAARSWRRPQA